MTEHATTDNITSDEPKPAVPDTHTIGAVPELVLEGTDLQQQIAENAADVTESLAEPVAESRAEAPADEAATPAAEEPATEPLAPKPAKKPRAPRAPKVADATASEEHPHVEPAATPDPALTVAVSPTEEATVAPKLENKKKWYAIKVQSGREDTIKAAILRKVAIEGFEETFGQILIPFEEVIEKKSVRVKDKKTGDYTTQEKKVVRKKKKFQGYLFAELEFNDRILYLFRETSGVGDFLNLRGTPPVPEPMPDHEVQQMLTGVVTGKGDKNKKVKLEFEKGDRVRIKEGSFANSEGEVKEISLPKDPTDAPKITVVVTFWGRPLDVELEYWQVAKV